MVVDDALRVAGGAGGVIQRDGVPLVVRQAPGEIGIAFVEEGFVILFTETLGTRIVGIDDVDDQRLRPLEQRQGGLDGLQKLRIGDQHLGFAVRQHEGDGLGIEAGVQRIEHGADHRHAEMALEHRRRVGQHDGDGVALADAATLQCGSKLATTVIAFLPRILPIPLNDGNTLGVDECRPLYEAQRGKRNIIGRILIQPDGVRV